MFNTISNKASKVLSPMPNNIVDKKGQFTFSQDTMIYVEPQFSSEAETFIDLLLEDLPYEEKGSGENELYIKKAKLKGKYRLEVVENKITVAAENNELIFMALETLRSLFLTYGHTIPCCKIIDWPKRAYRGFMLDVARHFVSANEIKKLLKVASSIHLNYFHWHLTDDQGWRFPLSFDEKVNKESSVRKAIDYQEERYESGLYSEDDIV